MRRMWGADDYFRPGRLHGARPTAPPERSPDGRARQRSVHHKWV